ncbi:hypothetical protein PoB_007641700 [Plakobranchus ocellatus]|uniref:Uncharacterized protein n=1 Tax=Plakobranchus ocellatus TaxID=259542 RepID=A0AAV4E0U4_9GAST|nr:hypothetical protein PoB_007641700 [Plakobranchus ocellatus]
MQFPSTKLSLECRLGLTVKPNLSKNHWFSGTMAKVPSPAPAIEIPIDLARILSKYMFTMKTPGIRVRPRPIPIHKTYKRVVSYEWSSPYGLELCDVPPSELHEIGCLRNKHRSA